MFDIRTIAVGAIGTGIKAWQLPRDGQIASVEIDNPTGSWVQIQEDGTFVPPYTLGFGHNLDPTQHSVNIVFVNGPSGQVSTQTGDNLVATIRDTPTSEAPGGAFIAQFTPTNTVSQNFLGGNILDLGGTTTQMVAGIAGKRIRLLSVFAALNPNSAGSGGNDSPSLWQVVGHVSSLAVAGFLTNSAPSSAWTGPMDFAVGEGLDAIVQGQWAQVTVLLTIVFQRI